MSCTDTLYSLQIRLISTRRFAWEIAALAEASSQHLRKNAPAFETSITFKVLVAQRPFRTMDVEVLCIAWEESTLKLSGHCTNVFFRVPPITTMTTLRE